MSDTDKTKPYWVKLLQNPQWRREDHDHRHGFCDLGTDPIHFGWWSRARWRGAVRRTCYYERKRGLRQRLYERLGERHYRDKYNGRQRTQLNITRRNLLKMAREDIASSDVQTFQHRHSALWDAD